MRSWVTQTTVAGSPCEVLRLLTEPDAIARWTPVPFEIVELDGDRLATGCRARVCGCLAGQRVEFDVRVLEADDGHLALVANGPISLEVDYGLSPRSGGSEVCARVSVRGSGLWGRALAAATEALLAGGAVQSSMSRLARELEPALAQAA